MTTRRRHRRRPAAALLAAAAALLAPGGAALLAPAGAAAQEATAPGTRTVTLREAVQIALRSNPSLREARAQVSVARSERLQARGSFLPDLSLAYGMNRSSTGRLDPTGQSITNTSNALQLEGSLDLFTGLRRFRDLDVAGRRVEAEEARTREARWRAVLDVKRAWLDAVARRQLVGVREGRVDRQRRQLEFVRERVARGKATHSDSLRARVQLNDARVALVNARNDARAATFALAEAMGLREPVAPASGATLEAEPLRMGRGELMAVAVRASPALEAAEAATRAAEARVSASRSSYLPDLTLSGGYAWRSESFPPDQRSWSWSLNASYPLFNGFRREAEVDRAQAEANAARSRRVQEELALRSQVDDAYNRVEAARANIRLAEENVELGREDLRVTRERYGLGLATIVDLQAAETGLAEAEVELVQRRFDHRVAVARLEALLGRDLAERGAAASGDTGAAPADGDRTTRDGAALPGGAAPVDDDTRDQEERP